MGMMMAQIRSVLSCGWSFGILALATSAVSVELPIWAPSLGQYAFDISTDSMLAQQYFRVGLILLYNFNQPTARIYFKAALEVDPKCSMCYWGLAHSYGPHLNQPTKSSEDLAAGLAASQNASALLAPERAKHSAKEQALIDSMANRYPENAASEDQLASYRKYASDIHRMRRTDPDHLGADPDLMVFDAEARMVLMCDDSGYHFYTSHGDNVPPTANPGTEDISELLRLAIKTTNQSHPYAQHLLIHSTEMSNAQAETAVQAARKLLKNMASLQSQHLQHMSSHTFFRTGYYHDAVTSNVDAVESDKAFLSHGELPYGPGHNVVFLICAAMWGGEREVAYLYAKTMREIFMKAPGRRDGPDGSKAWSYPMLTALKFGDWKMVSAWDQPPPGNYSIQWPYGYGVLRHFSLAVASVHLGDVTTANTHAYALQELMAVVRATANPEWINLTIIAHHTLTAVFAHSQGNLLEAVIAMRNAVEVEMAHVYIEPPAWLLPTRECYGQALIDAGLLIEAEQIFRTALYGYSFHAEPRCGWALQGLRTSLQKQQQNDFTTQREREIENLTIVIDEVWSFSDVPLTSPCLLLSELSQTVFI